MDMLLKLTRDSQAESQSNCAPVIQHVKSMLYAFFFPSEFLISVSKTLS